MYTRKQEAGRDFKVIAAIHSRDLSAIELKEFLEIESSVRGFGSAPPTAPSSWKKGSQISVIKAPLHVAQESLLRKVLLDPSKNQETLKMVDFGMKDLSKISAVGHVSIAKSKVDDRTAIPFIGPAVNFGDFDTVKKITQRKAVNFSPVIASRKVVSNDAKTLEESLVKQQIKASPLKKNGYRADFGSYK
jgi:hypothetical protein